MKTTQLPTMIDDVEALRKSPDLFVIKFPLAPTGDTEVFKVANEEQRIIEGFASTNDLDEYNDIIEPSAFENALPRFMQYPGMICVNHNWDNQVGLAQDLRIDASRGLWTQIKISAAEPGLWTKVQEKIYRAFSIAGRIVKSEYDSERNIRRILELVLYEISIVGLPANRQARIDVARSMHGAILNGNINRSTKEGNMPDIDLTKSTPTDVAALVEPEVKKQLGALGKDIGKQIDTVTEGAVKSAFADALKDESSELGKAVKLMNQVLEAQKNAVTKSDFDAFKSNIQADFTSAAMAVQRSGIERPKSGGPGFAEFPIDAYSLQEVLRRDAVTKQEDSDAQEMGLDPVMYRLQMVDPLQLSGYDGERVAKFQRQAQKVAMVHAIMCNSKSYRSDPRRIKTLKSYQRMVREFQDLTKGVAMDTATAAEGLEWVPTIMNPELIRRIEIEAVVARLFRRETMPTAAWPWPVMGAGASTYVMSQATTDSMTALITASVVGTANIQLDAVKLGCWVPVSTELVEDAILSTLNVVQDEVVTAFRRGMDNCILNGDADGTHQDTDVQAVTAHNNKLFNGLRRKALSASASKKDMGAVGITAPALRELRKKMLGARVENPADLAFILSGSDYINLLSDERVATVDKFGADATWLKGVLMALDAIPIVLSDFVRTDVDATGVNGAAANTFSYALCVHKPSWAIGDRRQVTIESDKVIWTDQLHVVGTWRGDFENIRTSNYPVTILYNIDPQ